MGDLLSASQPAARLRDQSPGIAVTRLAGGPSVQQKRVGCRRPRKGDGSRVCCLEVRGDRLQRGHLIGGQVPAFWRTTMARSYPETSAAFCFALSCGLYWVRYVVAALISFVTPAWACGGSFPNAAEP